MKDTLFKKMLLLSLTLLAFAAATEAGPVDMRQAREVGARFVNNNTHMRTTANDLRLVTTYSTFDGVAAFHVFNTSNGFVIVAADDCSIPILAYSEEGQLDVNNIPVQMEGYLQVYRREIEHGIQHRLTADESISKQWNMLRTTGSLYGTRATTEVEPLLTTIWDQGCYYNALCPEDTLGPCGHVYTGCVATAMGQIMRFWQYPEVGSGSYTYYPDGYPEQTAYFGSTVYDWNNMPDELNGSSSEAEINAVATLLWHCGVAVNMGYGPYGSGAYHTDVPYAMTEYFNYSNELYGMDKTDNDTWLALIKSNLDSGMPVFYRGADSNAGGAHAFVCDGYDANDYLHFNWGWSGSGNNAYFALDALNVNGNQYNDYNYAIFDIHPDYSVYYQIEAEAYPVEGGTVMGGDSYVEGSVCTLTAVGAYDYVFVNWTKDGIVVSTNPVFSFEVTEDAVYTANFELFEGIAVGEGSFVTNEFFPSYSYYCYSLTEQIYTPEDLQQAGVIRTLAFYNDGTTKTQDLDIYLAYTDKNAFESTTDWIAVTENDLVFSGVVTLIAGTWTTLTLDNTIVYDGTSNLVLVVDNNTGSWTDMPNMACRVFETDDIQAMRVYSDPTNYDPYNPSAYTGTLYTQKNQLRLAFDELTPSYSSEPIVTPDPLTLGYRPNNAWMRPYTFQIYNPGNYSYINSITTDNPFFQLEEVEVPFAMGYLGSLELDMTTGNSEGEEEGHLIINYGDNQTLQYDLSAVAYDPAIKDVWETAYEVTEFPFTDNLVVSEIPLYNNYDLPPVETEDGADAVYKLVFDQDVLLNASITNGENGKIALYTEDFNGEGGPTATNYFKELNAAAAAEPFEVQIGDGTTSSGYMPFYCYYNYSISQQLFTADELAEAGVTSAPMTSLSWYCTSSNGNLQSNITIWMANVEETSIGTSSMVTGSMAKVYEGNMTPAANQWNEFEFNQGSFAWDGHSNILVSVQRNNGAWASGVNWQMGAQSFIAGGYSYTDESAYDMAANTYTFGSSGSSYGSTTTNRANIIMKGGSREAGNRDIITQDFESGLGDWTMYNCHSNSGVNTGYTAHGGSGVFRFYYTTAFPQYLISPMLPDNNGGTMSFYYARYSASYEESFQVGYSTTTNDPSAFTWDSEVAVTNLYTSGYLENISNFPAGTKYVAIACTSNDQFYLFIDDITITSLPPVSNDGITVPQGTYYLVASSTSDEWSIEINTDVLPCPEMASNPIPADNATEVVPTAVKLKWTLGERTTEYKLLFGLDQDNMSTLVDWTRDLAESYLVSGLLNNTTYYWQIMERNDGCPEGVEGSVWAFSTQLNAPYLYCNSTTLFNDEYLRLHWTPLADTCILSYNIYQDNEWIGSTTADYYEMEPFAYNMQGYNFHITAQYVAGESNPSNTITVMVSGYGNVEGHVYEQDGVTGIENATITFFGQNEFGYTNNYYFTTDAEGYYTGILEAGTYSATASCDGYQDKNYDGVISVAYNETTAGIDLIMDELFNPVSDVFAKYYPDAEDPNSPYVEVSWSKNPTGVWHTYCESENFTAVSSSVGQENWAYEYPAAFLFDNYAGWRITKVSLFSDNIYNAVGGNYTCRIYVGGTVPAEGMLVSELTVDVPQGLNDWVDWDLTTPVSVTGEDPIWVVWTANTKLNNWPAGCFTGDLNDCGTWWNGGDGWEHLTYGNWAMRQWFSSLASRSEVVSAPLAIVDTNPISCNLRNFADGDNGSTAICINSEATEGVSIAWENNRSFSYYRVYRTDAYNDGPYTEDNTVLLADNVNDTILIDVTWQDAEAGVYKYGVSCVYAGNRDGNNTIQEPRESEIVWSNPMEQNMYLGENEVNLTVSLNSGDSPEGVLVRFTNLNEVEQAAYPIEDIILDATGYYAFDSFRRGAYVVEVSFNDYYTITEEVSIWDATALNYLLNEINYSVSNLYVSRTGWATWKDEQHGNTVPIIEETVNTFSVDFEEGLPADWTVIDANNDGYTWCLTSAIPTTWTYYASMTLDWYHNGTNAICSGSYINGVGALNPDEYLISPRVDIVNGSQLSFWVAATDANYAADHFGVFVSTTGTNPEDFTSVQEWTLTAKGESKAGNDRASREGKGLRMATWRNYTVDLSAYAGNACYIAFRHYNCYDQYVMCIDDVELSDGTEGKSNRHFNQYQVVLSDAEDNIIYEEAISDCYLQLPVENLVDDETYHLKVASVYSSGLSEWNETDWVYQSCSNFEGFSELTAEFLDEGNTISWNYPALVNHSYDVQIGNGTGVIMNSPIYDYYNYSLSQHLFLASELETMGVVSGMINSIGWYRNTSANNQLTHHIRIWLDNVMDNIVPYTSADVNAMTLVYDDEYTIMNGWDMFDLIPNFVWDGESNLLVVVAMDGIGTNDNNLASWWRVTETDFNSTNSIYNTDTPFHPENETYSLGYSPVRPNIRIVSNSISCKGAMLYREGELLGFTRGTSYTDTIVAGNHEYEIRLVYDGAAELPYNNMYYSMSCPQSIGGAIYEVTVAAEPEQGIVVTGAGSYINGFPCTLTATANSSSYLFENWTVNGEVVSTEPTYTFIVHEDAVCVAHFVYGQDTPLTAGWNWWSTYVEQEGIDGLLMLENSLGGAGIRIQGFNASIDYFEYQGVGYWYGPLNEITNERMYKIRTNESCNAVLIGNPLDVANHPITINPGWNWIGFPADQSLDINDALSGLTAEPDDIIKGRNVFASYVSSGDYNLWYGTMNTLEPGQGYMYKSNSSTPKTLVIQTGRESGELVPNVTPYDNFYVPADANYADNMLITAVIEVDGEELRSEDYELAAFAGDECRGSVKLMYVEPFDRYVAFLLVFGDEAESLHFVLTDGRDLGTSGDQITYMSDGMAGSLTEPVTLHFGTLGLDGDQMLVNIYPNPSKGLFNIEGKGIQKIEVVDIFGQVILSSEVENDYLQINLSDKAEGTYLLRIVTANGITTRKLVTTK